MSATVHETFMYNRLSETRHIGVLSKNVCKKPFIKSDKSSMAEKQARADALKVRAAFAKKEAKLKKRKAALGADLELLSEQKRAAVVNAEVSALESLRGSLKGSNSNVHVKNALDHEGEFANVHSY
ncbi:hypothetical protein DPMN_048807 [Dreissena polymorpha]|uniref:Uncharacterized protein n=1 Tax=Dreissena polymorpha TaxID=45954 RepID=A0A9D4I2Q7_DREPO|nr:hypothetical protein DPMN_048807 [Dreissena polymorpha]